MERFDGSGRGMVWYGMVKLEPSVATGCVDGSTPMVWYGRRRQGSCAVVACAMERRGCSGGVRVRARCIGAVRMYVGDLTETLFIPTRYSVRTSTEPLYK